MCVLGDVCHAGAVWTTVPPHRHDGLLLLLQWAFLLRSPTATQGKHTPTCGFTVCQTIPTCSVWWNSDGPHLFWLFVCVCVLDPVRDSSTTWTEECVPDAPGASGERWLLITQYHDTWIYYFTFFWFDWKYQSSSNMIYFDWSFHWCKWYASPVWVFCAQICVLYAAINPLSTSSGGWRPSPGPATQVCVWVRKGLVRYVCSFWFLRQSTSLILIVCVCLCVWLSCPDWPLFCLLPALMHQSNNVDSSRCYQCVKFLITLAQK